VARTRLLAVVFQVSIRSGPRKLRLLKLQIPRYFMLNLIAYNLIRVPKLLNGITASPGRQRVQRAAEYASSR